ncbi:aminopeptidase N-like [Solenopsis invicta]|uniref:aminopeptidase N-like n=1 Tax=Solenopsis invicta TaxID=13686 RepID=UPI00193E2E9F|nr:aminopeptidase N-like [Solenopsis invicta]
MRFLLPLMLAVAACWASSPPFEIDPPQAIEEILDDYKLPTNVIPTAYNITLDPIFDSDNETLKFTFRGKSVITLNITEETNIIKFHAKGLEGFIKENITLHIDPKNSTDPTDPTKPTELTTKPTEPTTKPTEPTTTQSRQSRQQSRQSRQSRQQSRQRRQSRQS